MKECYRRVSERDGEGERVRSRARGMGEADKRR